MYKYNTYYFINLNIKLNSEHLNTRKMEKRPIHKYFKG